jgi:hypothetical protein
MLKEQTWDPFVELKDNLRNTDLLNLGFREEDWEIRVEDKNCQASRLVLDIDDEVGLVEPGGAGDGSR